MLKNKNVLRPGDFKTTLRLTLLENLQFGTGLELDPFDGERKREGEGRLVEPGREQVHVASNVGVALRVGHILFRLRFIISYNVLKVVP